MDKKTKGSWLVHQTSKLQNVNNQASFENTYFAGKAGILLSALSSDDQTTLPKSKVDILARASNVNSRLELPQLLDTLEKRGLIDTSEHGVEILGVTTAATLQHTTDIFESLEPTDTEQAALALSEHCSEKPQSDDEVKEEIGDSYSLSDDQVSSLCSESEAIGFIDVEKIDSDTNLYFNGNLFRRGNAQKVHAVLSSMSSDDQRKINELDGMITKNACVTIEKATAVLGQSVFDKVCSIGIYDISVVSNSEEEVGYLTKASAFSKFSDPLVDDAFDLAKAFVSSLTYGMTRSQYARGQIRMIEALLGTLIAGRPVGPVRAIENDYKILELKNVVKVYHGENKGRTGPLLKLLKKEVGILALEVIRKGDVSEQSLSILPSAAITQYSGPEVNRERKRRTQVQSNSKATNDMLLALRTGGAFK